MSLVLSGVPNEGVYSNFRMIAENFYEKRKENPVLTATTLLTPGYLDIEEGESIAKFIAELDREIPYSLLVFFLNFYDEELRTTPLNQVRNCYKMAKKYFGAVQL